ncbi:hypothetical protein [Amycolatopsis thermophila]|uniref:Uncharacterized protein n=1 Tax=Amycolatopsis thermophila TaxID=206084 RepID=A0ABU0EST5_9PSEU|nr:hypothetical protein [Amycolatopsis thermophila]MDQ0378021.1 hypothetical protein [Amycolatopsis thermophila]
MTEVPQLETPFDEVLNAFAELGNDADPTRVELVTSEILGEWWEADDDLAAGLIDLAASTPEPERLVAPLAALRVLATDEDQREAAGLALEKFGLPEPAWASRLNRATPGECWRTTDVYGDESSVLVSFGDHGLVVSINYGSFGGWVTDAAIVESPRDVLAELRGVEGAVTSEEISAETAHEVIADAFAGTEWQAEPEVGEDFVRFRALALARLRTLPEPAEAEEPEPLSVEEQAEVIDSFFAAAGDEIGDTEDARVVALRLIEFGMEHDPHRPLRVGPAKLESFVDFVDDGQIELTGEQDAAMAELLPVWARVFGDRDGLPEDALTALVEAVEDRLDDREPDSESSLDAYLAGSEDLTPEDVQDLLERRQFALPSLTVETEDDEVELDPSDPEERRMLVLAEFAAEFEGDDDSELRAVALTTVVDQLWDGEPAEAWAAAQRLTEAGLERDEVLAELTAVLEEHLTYTEDDELEFDLDDYTAALDELDAGPED